MPTVDENRRMWDRKWDWSHSGDEWSSAWGSPDMQWHFTILPRIHAFLPAPTILEIAPGFGRWTQFLKDLCDRLIVVDLAEKSIDACRTRFADDAHVECFVNDGKSLAMVDDGSLDFAFSFDSLVHAEPDVIAAYLQQLAVKLKPDGVGVIHHSNLGQHSQVLSRLNREGYARVLFKLAAKIHPMHKTWRAPAMSADRFRADAQAVGLSCISQEKINWGCSRTIDCISIFVKPGSRWASRAAVSENANFMREAKYVSTLAPLYARALPSPASLAKTGRDNGRRLPQ